MFRINGEAIKQISIVADDSDTREAYGNSVEELDVIPVLQNGPLPQIDQFLKKLTNTSQALLCDYHLRKKNYAGFDGDELVVHCYKKQFPAVLYTTYTDFDSTLMRSRRRYIPALLKPNDAEPHAIAKGIENCVNEFKGNFLPSRRPWRTLVRIEEVNPKDKYFYVVISGWDPHKKIRLYFDDLPKKMHDLIKPEKRLHAEVNVGTEIDEDIYFDKWEVS